MAGVCQSPEDLSLDVLRQVLSSPSLVSFRSTKIGTGQVGSVYRLHIEYADSTQEKPRPSSIILKLASTDETSRRVGLSLGIYEREVRFYSETSPALLRTSSTSLAECYHAAFDPESGTFTLLLEDAGEAAYVGDDVKGATIDQARIALAELGRLHAAFLKRSPEELAMQESARSWLERPSPLSGALFSQLFAGFKMRYEKLIEPAHLGVCSKLVTAYDAYSELANKTCVQGLVHGDYRMDNMLFTSRMVEEGRPTAVQELAMKIVDWQTITWTALAGDVAYFLGSSLKTEDRRSWTEELLQAYCDAVGEQDGNPLYPLDQCKEDVRMQSYFGVTMAIASSMLAGQTERGDAMFMTFIERNCQMVLDLGALDLLPDTTPLPALRPKAEDEQPHTSGAEPNWNESWYFDFVDESQGLAGWVRLGLLPNQKGNWYIAAITRNGQPTVIVQDLEAPHVENDLTLKSQHILATHATEDPLQMYHVMLTGSGRSFAEDSAGLTDHIPDRTPILELDLNFKTAGIPYQYKITTRYEIPCAVTGTIKIDGQEYSIRNVPGQRDHSWGVRDWWSMDWIWSTVHTIDGKSHYHGLDLRIPGAPQMSIGYAQTDGVVAELETYQCQEKMQEDGSARDMNAQLSSVAGEKLTLEVAPKGHAGLRLVSGEGRICLFERAWCKIRLSDGRDAVGWYEWNRNVEK